MPGRDERVDVDCGCSMTAAWPTPPRLRTRTSSVAHRSASPPRASASGRPSSRASLAASHSSTKAGLVHSRRPAASACTSGHVRPVGRRMTRGCRCLRPRDGSVRAAATHRGSVLPAAAVDLLARRCIHRLGPRLADQALAIRVQRCRAVGHRADDTVVVHHKGDVAGQADHGGVKLGGEFGQAREVLGTGLGVYPIQADSATAVPCGVCARVGARFAAGLAGLQLSSSERNIQAVCSCTVRRCVPSRCCAVAVRMLMPMLMVGALPAPLFFTIALRQQKGRPQL